MNCVICKTGQAVDGATTVTLQRSDSVIVIKDVPAKVCGDCGEYYLDESTSAKVCALAEKAVALHTEVEVLRYAA